MALPALTTTKSSSKVYDAKKAIYSPALPLASEKISRRLTKSPNLKTIGMAWIESAQKTLLKNEELLKAFSRKKVCRPRAPFLLLYNAVKKKCLTCKAEKFGQKWWEDHKSSVENVQGLTASGGVHEAVRLVRIYFAMCSKKECVLCVTAYRKVFLYNLHGIGKNFLAAKKSVSRLPVWRRARPRSNSERKYKAAAYQSKQILRVVRYYEFHNNKF